MRHKTVKLEDAKNKIKAQKAGRENAGLVFDGLCHI